MSDADHEQLHRDLGAYLLGALEPASRDRFERHLSGCVTCRNELADLAVLPTLLSRLDTSTAGAVDPPPFAPVLDGVIRQRRNERRRERALAAVTALACAVAAAVVLLGPPGADAPAGRAFTSDDGLVQATVEEKPWGMAVHIAADDLPARDGYIAQAVARDGHRAQIATWSDTGGPVDVTGGCYLDAQDVERVEIVDPSDDKVLVVLSSG